jgi:hypothetical protein
VAAVKLVRPVRRDDNDPLVAQARRQERKKRAGRAVGPVDVLQPEDRAVVLAQAFQKGEQRVEEAALCLALAVLVAFAPGGPQLRGDPRELRANGSWQVGENGIVLARERPHRPDERRVRELVLTEFDALTTQNPSAQHLCLVLELAQQARLADARLARDEYEPRLARAGVG